MNGICTARGRKMGRGGRRKELKAEYVREVSGVTKGGEAKEWK